MMTNDETPGGKRIAELRQSIERAFPAKPYVGKIMPFDEKLDDPEMDEERELYDALKGHKWTEVPKQILHNQPDAYVLLTDEAFTAFIAAWLMCSLEDMEGENEVRNFLVYAFSPKHDKQPDTTEFVRHQIRALNQEQRHTLRSILLEVAAREPSSFLGKLASEAVALVDTAGA